MFFGFFASNGLASHLPMMAVKQRYFRVLFVKKPMGYTQLLYFSLGDFVTHPDRPNWGIGQIQSIVGMNVTVNFEHAGKQMINCNIVALNAAPCSTK